MSTRLIYDVSIWEEIRSIVRWKTDRLVGNISKEIPKDLSLSEFHGTQPIPWQLREIMERRANTWVQSVYDICCDAHKNNGKAPTADFDRAVWAYCAASPPQATPVTLSETVSALPALSPVQETPETEAQKVTKGDMPALSSGKETATWDTIEIWFLSDERVQVRNSANLETRNYAELGFEDGRTGKPNQAWETLRVLAEKRGVIRDGTTVDHSWPKVEKRIQDIRKVLREHFGISADPIPFVSGLGYRARFKIGCSPSFHT